MICLKIFQIFEKLSEDYNVFIGSKNELSSEEIMRELEKYPLQPNTIDENTQQVIYHHNEDIDDNTEHFVYVHYDTIKKYLNNINCIIIGSNEVCKSILPLIIGYHRFFLNFLDLIFVFLMHYLVNENIYKLYLVYLVIFLAPNIYNYILFKIYVIYFSSVLKKHEKLFKKYLTRGENLDEKLSEGAFYKQNLDKKPLFKLPWL
jgi:hypothetical protein